MVCSFSDFQDSHITLQTQVYDIDNYYKINDIVSATSSMAGNVVGTFPVIGPYIAAGKAVASSREIRNPQTERIFNLADVEE